MIPRYIILAFIISCLMGCVRHDPLAFYKGRQNFLNQNYGLARVQLMEPAEAGDPEAQYAVGYMYLNGLGTPADNQAALKWITLSSKAGYPPAQEALQVIKPEMAALSVYDNYAIPSAPPASYKRSKKTRWWRPFLNEKHQTKVIEIPAQADVVTQASQDRPVPIPSQTSPLEGNHEKTLMGKSASSYTIQIIGTHDLNSIHHFVKTHRLEKNTRYYTTQRDGKAWYSLLYGVYPSSAEAANRINQLPDALKSYNPWVKPMKQVHHEISNKK